MLDALVASATISTLVVSSLFVAVYATRRWFETATGWSVMALACSLVVLAVGAVIYRFTAHPAGEALLAVGWFAVAATMAWRTWTMWRLNRNRKEK